MWSLLNLKWGLSYFTWHHGLGDRVRCFTIMMQTRKSLLGRVSCLGNSVISQVTLINFSSKFQSPEIWSVTRNLTPRPESRVEKN